MELCTDPKLKEHLKKDLIFSVSELKPPSARKVSKKERSGESPDYKNPLERKPIQKEREVKELLKKINV